MAEAVTIVLRCRYDCVAMALRLRYDSVAMVLRCRLGWVGRTGSDSGWVRVEWPGNGMVMAW